MEHFRMVCPADCKQETEKMAKEGKQLPNADVVTEITNEIKQMIFDNHGLSANRPLDFTPILERLENV